MTAATDLFAGKDVWTADPALAFDTWLNSKGYTASTIKIKRAMWGRVASWMESRGLALQQLSATDIEAFLRTRPTRKEQHYRYIKLLEQVYLSTQLTATNQLVTPNSASALLASKRWYGGNRDTHIPSSADRNRLKTYMVSTCQQLLGQTIAGNDADEWQARWKWMAVNCMDKTLWLKLRNLALVATAFGGGVKEGELKHLTVGCIESDGWLTIPASRRAPRHRTQLLPFARPVLAAWQAVFQAEPKSILFPGWTLNADAPGQSSMDPATIYRGIRDEMINAGCEGVGQSAARSPNARSTARWGAQSLRNGFAAEHFELMESPEQAIPYLTLAMGLTGTAVGTDAVIRLYKAWREQSAPTKNYVATVTR